MSRYIDAEHLLAKVSRMIDYCEKDPLVSGLSALFSVGDAIMDCPTADVVEVVRCKDCSYCRYVDDADIYRCDRRGYYAEEVKPDDYCSRGERREG